MGDGAGDGASEPLALDEICAVLAEKGLKPWEIEKLDRWWIAYVYFAPRGKYGELKVRKKVRDRNSVPMGREAFAAMCKTHGWADWLIDHAWNEAVAKVKAEKDAATKGKGQVK